MPPRPLPVIADTYRVALKWLAGSQTAVNVMNVRTTTSGKTAGQVATCLDTHVTSAMWGGIVTGASVEEVDVTPLDGVSASVQFATGAPAKWSGGTAGDFVPQVAALVKLRTSERGPAHRGRIFLPFIGEAQITDGAVAGAEVTAMSNAWTTFVGAIFGDATCGLDLGVASYKHATFLPVTTVAVELQTGTQRRRQTRNRT